MKNFISLIVSFMLVLNLSPAAAGSHKSKPDNDPGPSATAPQSGDTDRHGDRKHASDGDCCSKKHESDHDCCGDQKHERGQECCTDRNQDCCDDHPGKGNERSEEMLERRDERKEEKAEYKSDRVPGQEGKSDKGAPNESADEDARKPWYEFWE